MRFQRQFCALWKVFLWQGLNKVLYAFFWKSSFQQNNWCQRTEKNQVVWQSKIYHIHRIIQIFHIHRIIATILSRGNNKVLECYKEIQDRDKCEKRWLDNLSPAKTKWKFLSVFDFTRTGEQNNCSFVLHFFCSNCVYYFYLRYLA